jgi:HD-GYP domain-containing protein (c-di-GMP phosphodiesterase class II)
MSALRAVIVLACTLLIACAAIVAVDRLQAEATAGRDADLVRWHHERPDGTGYPDALTGDEIPIGARIIAVSDVFDAMVSDRHYRGGRSVEEALAELRRCAGTQFDPAVVEAFAAVVAERDRISAAPRAA